MPATEYNTEHSTVLSASSHVSFSDDSAWNYDRVKELREEDPSKKIMLKRSHIPEARWWVVQAVDKKRARLNFIDHLLKQFPYGEVEKTSLVFPPPERRKDYSRQPVSKEMLVPEVY